MDSLKQNVLYIDDHCLHYQATLELAAQSAGFHLFSVDNVLESLDFLDEYGTAMEAVILDLGFPKGEMQGTEALEKIKKKFGHLPVIMLTDSDSAADIDKVVQCMKQGAYDYVGKKTLNPVYLFQLVDNAIQLSRQIHYVSAGRKKTSETDTFFTTRDDYELAWYKKRGLFGFELFSVAKPTDERSELNLKVNALAWHENLLNAISNPFREALQLHLKFIADKGTLTFRFIFSVYGETDEKLNHRLANTQHDIKAFFTNGIDNQKNPYQFVSITDEQVLTASVVFPDSFKYNLFFRNPLKIKSGGLIGFNAYKSEGPKVVGKMPLYQPNEIFPLPEKLNISNELFRAMKLQEHYTEIDVMLLPKALLIEEIEMLRQVSKNPLLIQDADYNPKELEWYAEYCSKFIQPGNEKFMISILLKRDGGQVQQHLKKSIQQYFFGNTPVNSEFRDAKNLMRFSSSKEGDINQLPFFYALDQAIQAFRLPFPDSNSLEGINALASSFTQIPANLPTGGILLGEKKILNETKPIRIAEDALARHLYMMGQTGTGKSTMLKTMITDCLHKNYGFALIDPHGDLFDEVQKLIPKAKRNKVVILNTSDPEHSARHNPIGYDENNPQSKSLIINELIRIFGTLYDMRSAGGPMFELYFKHGLLLIMDDAVEHHFGKSSILNIVDVFHDDDYRKKLLDICSNQRVVTFFKTAKKTSGDQSFENYAPYITSKLTRFTEDFYLTPIISSKKGNINFRKLMDDGNILLVKMDKGLIGSDNVSLLGQMLVSSLVLGAMSRGSMDWQDRKPFYLFIDEFQNFIKGDVASALSEVRKYGLSLTLANQTLGQLEDKMVEALMGNVGSMVFFRPGINDYEKIKHYVEPEFTREDVLKLPNFHCISRLLIDNIPCEPFVFQNKYE